MIAAKLDYFMPGSGKWKYEGTVLVEADKPLFEIWQDLRDLLKTDPPGIKTWSEQYFVVADVPDHRHAHPTLLFIPEHSEDDSVSPPEGLYPDDVELRAMIRQRRADGDVHAALSMSEHIRLRTFWKDVHELVPKSTLRFPGATLAALRRMIEDK
jgi:hypothetical protein